MGADQTMQQEDDTPMDGSSRTGFARRLLPVAILVCGLIGFFAFDLDRFVSFQALSDNRDRLQEWVGTYPLAARLGYALAYMLAIAFSLPVGLVLTVTGGLLFGLVEGTLLTVVAATLGAIAVFLAARTAIGDSLRARAGPFVARLEDGFRENALSYLLVLRLVPLFPFWLVNIVPALLGVSTRIFALGTLVGIIPGTFVFVSVGNGLDTVFDRGEIPGVGIFLEPGVLIPIIGLTLLSLIPIAYKRLRRGDPSSV
jgi:uncharacterized membrane protein YdjX (TVP38/TMEM64 family)